MTYNRYLAFFLVLTILACNNSSKNEPHDFNRNIPLEGQVNFRDLGNYQNDNGKSIKTGLIYRSGTLAKLTEKDVKKLDSLGIKTVINFLDNEELEKYGKDKLPEGVKSFYLPIEGQNNEVTAVTKARLSGDFSEVPADFNYQIHALLAEGGKEVYAEMFHILSDKNNYPIVFHCSHGVHRTGNAAALLLTSLGVPWETVKEDYMLSNEYRKEESEKRIKALNLLAEKSGVKNLEQNDANIRAFYILQPEYIDGTKTTIEDNYGNIQQYLNSVGVTKTEIENIQQILIK